MQLLSSLGIEWKVIIAQAVNFGILVFVLYKFVYKPLLKVLDERTAMIKDAAEKSSTIDSKLEEIKALEESTLVAARKAGAELIRDAEAAAAVLKAKLGADATAEATKIVREAEARIKSSEETLRNEIKAEMKDIVASAIEATVGKYLDSAAKQKLADEASHEALMVEKVVAAHK